MLLQDENKNVTGKEEMAGGGTETDEWLKKKDMWESVWFVSKDWWEVVGLRQREDETNIAATALQWPNTYMSGRCSLLASLVGALG